MAIRFGSSSPASYRNDTAVRILEALATVALAVVGATGCGFMVDPWMPVANISVIYLTAVMLVAMEAGLWPAIAASVISFFAFNYFFTDPRGSLAISDMQNVVTVFFFLLAAVLVSNLAGRLRKQIGLTRESVARTENLYAFSRRAAEAGSLDAVVDAVVQHVSATVGGQCLVLLPHPEGSLQPAGGHPPSAELDMPSRAAADWCWRNGQPAGRQTARAGNAAWRVLPMQTARGLVGVLAIRPDRTQDWRPQTLIEALADQAAVAIERTRLADEFSQARLVAERERLRSALLSSLSHDLRTPLVSILGAGSSLIADEQALDPDQRRELAHTIQDEAERLNRFVQNLLDMTRLGTGALVPRLDWTDLADVVAAAVSRIRRYEQRHRFRIDLDPEMGLLKADAVLLEQALFNLLDNACKYAPEGTPVTIWARQRSETVKIEVSDEGPGIPLSDREHVFDMFYRIGRGDARPPGTGLGLSIARGIVRAHGGSIKVQSGLHDQGTSVVLELPVSPAPSLPAPDA